MTEPLDEDICRDDCTSGCHATDCEHHGHATRATLPVPGAGVTAEPLTDTLDVERLVRAEHLWCVQVEGACHKPEAHRKQAEFILAALADTREETT